MPRPRWWVLFVALCGLVGPASGAKASHDLAVELWTDRGNNGVYDVGEEIAISARASDDAYLLVYEIDSEGYVHMLYPSGGSNGWVEGRTTLDLPPKEAGYQLVTQGPEGVGYVVAVAARQPFHELPWYLRPYDSDVEPNEYEGERDDEQGVTREGRIVGDPFVAMERIRRTVCGEDLGPEDVSSAYVTYYVGHQFRYPRYLCYDCHRPGYWAWWDGFDPYYAACPVFSFRVNYNWWWGYPCWYGFVPYYYYVVRYDCPPFYRHFAGYRYSGWDGWSRWNSLWGNRLVRYKPAQPPVGYQAPIRAKDGTYIRKPDAPPPPGFRNPNGGDVSRIGAVPVGRMTRTGPPTRGPATPPEPAWRRGAEPSPGRRPVIGRMPEPPSGGSDPATRPERLWRNPGPQRSPFVPRDESGIRRIDRPRPVERAPDVQPGRDGRQGLPAPAVRREAPPRLEREPGGARRHEAPSRAEGRGRGAPADRRPAGTGHPDGKSER